MREIKFRAWDKELGMSRDCFCIHATGLIAYSNNEWLSDEEKPIIMQYTGLKDKNGKEIYEGDIIEDTAIVSSKVRGDVQFSCGVFGIEWIDAKRSKSLKGAWGQRHNLRTMDDDLDPSNGFEVIGNIYENPELLENTK